MVINLENREAELRKITTVAFHEMMALPPNIRPDTKTRTGLYAYDRQIGTRNQIGYPIDRPSKFARIFAIEKAVRSEMLGHSSSANSANEDKLWFPGSVTYIDKDGVQWQFSTSGAQSPEDVAFSVWRGAYVIDIDPAEFCENVRKTGGLLPTEFDEPKYYLYPFVH